MTNDNNTSANFQIFVSDIITEIREDALAVPIQCVTVRTPDQLKKKETKSEEQVAKADSSEAEADSSAKETYVPDKDGFVTVVFVVEDGSAKAIQVKSGIQSETHIEIVDGLSEGDEIVTGSYRAISQTLQNNSQVEVKNEGQKK